MAARAFSAEEVGGSAAMTAVETAMSTAQPTAQPRGNQGSADFQVCRVAGFQTRTPFLISRSADLEIGDTAGLETCATAKCAKR
jgi:hypothetical protein